MTENGFGKRVETEEFAPQHRYGLGRVGVKLGDKTGKLSGIALVKETDDLMMITDGGMFVRTHVSGIPVYGRYSSGVIVMRMKPGEILVGLDVVAQEPEEEEAAEGGQTDEAGLPETGPETETENPLE